MDGGYVVKGIKPRPKARIKLGHHFMGEKTSTTAEGYALYKEWDSTDKKFYTWEEWELRGFNDIDSWIEYDHYTRQVSLYEPIRRAEKIDPRGLTKQQTIMFNHNDTVIPLTVKEAGAGTLTRREGTFSYHIFEGEKMEYAELVDPRNSAVRYCSERYNDREFDMYRSTILSKADQKRILGKVVAPLNLSWQALFWIIIGTYIAVTTFIPRTETTCTPRTTSSSSSLAVTSSQSSSQPTSSQNCQTRTVYGFGSGGSGGGVGK